MKLIPQAISDVVLIEPKVFGDDRGFFFEVWRADRFADGGIDAAFVQDNHSRSAHGVLRGLHYQVGRPQGKLVRVVSGEIYDVAVDLRRGSTTFGQWVGATLSAANKRQLWIPAGFGHGFLVTGDHAEVTYKCTDFYAPACERTIIWNDADLAIQWPMNGVAPQLSAKDLAGLSFSDAELFA